MLKCYLQGLKGRQWKMFGNSVWLDAWSPYLVALHPASQRVEKHCQGSKWDEVPRSSDRHCWTEWTQFWCCWKRTFFSAIRRSRLQISHWDNTKQQFLCIIPNIKFPIPLSLNQLIPYHLTSRFVCFQSMGCGMLKKILVGPRSPKTDSFTL